MYAHIDRKVHTPSHRHCAMTLSAKVEGGRGDETVGEGTCKVKKEEEWDWALYRACRDRISEIGCGKRAV